MAEAVLNIVLGKLADIIVKEAQLLGGVGKKVERVQRELTRIKCCLQDADSKRKGDARVQNWLNELRDVAYRIEDTTDMFFLEVEDHNQKNPGGVQNSKCCSRCLQKLKKLLKKPLEVPILHKLGNELDDIQNLLKEIYESRLTYGISDLQDNSKGEADVIMLLRRAAYSEVDETNIVGMQADKNNILKLLHPSQTLRRAVITIVGPGGLGKTTLAHMVYKSARANFDYYLMLSISQKFSLIDLLRKMISKYNKDFVRENQDVGDLANELKSYLRSRKYLIILDDVWDDDLCNQLKDVLPDATNGSRILITSRFVEVARFADSQIPPYELKFLDDSESLNLFIKKALPYDECPNDLLELAHKLSEKCKGLPLALIVLGGIISTKEPSYFAWERVLQTMDWHSDGSGCMQILAMSYEDMPYYLKACFQYLASFPEDYEISTKRLIRMWVAEGFIPLEGKTTIEIMAENYLEELAKRSMVQVLSRSTNGLIKSFKVHDILRELAMHEAEHENFVTVFSHASNDTKPNRIIRRALLQVEEKNSQFIRYVGSNTRSLLWFQSEEFEIALDCSNFRLLKVLEIVGNRGAKLTLKSLDELIHLKYLGLRNCEIDLSSCSFQRMRSLETLIVEECRGNDQPCDDFWSIGTLRHVHGFFLNPLPKGIDLNYLQTLRWAKAQGACDWKLPNLRKVGFRIEFWGWVSITNILQMLPHLVSLKIDAGLHILPMEIVYPKALPNYQNLQSLYLNGTWPTNVNVEAMLLPPHLVKLTIALSGLNHNPMPELGKLNGLKNLRLRSFLTPGWEGPINCPEGFPVLQYLTVYDTEIKDLTVEEGVMPKLTYLRVNEWHTEVHLPHELQHVTIEKTWS